MVSFGPYRDPEGKARREVWPSQLLARTSQLGQRSLTCCIELVPRDPADGKPGGHHAPEASLTQRLETFGLCLLLLRGDQPVHVHLLAVTQECHLG